MLCYYIYAGQGKQFEIPDLNQKPTKSQTSENQIERLDKAQVTSRACHL